MAELTQTVGQWLSDGLAQGDSKEDLDADFKLEYGVPTSAFHPNTKLSDLQANKKKILADMPKLIRPKTEEEIAAEDAAAEAAQANTPEDQGENNGSEERQYLAHQSLPKHRAELTYHPIDKLVGIAKDAYRSVNPTDAEAARYGKERMQQEAFLLPGETTAEGDLLQDEPAKFPDANKKTGTVGKPEQENLVYAGVKGLLKGSPPAVGLGLPFWNPPEGSPKTERARTSGRNERIERNANHHPIINAISDVGDVVTVFPKMLSDALLGDYVPEGLSDEEQSTIVQRRGRQLGQEFISGAVGGTSAIGEGFAHHPINSLASRPATVAVTVGAPLHALSKLSKAVALKAGVNPAEVVGNAAETVSKATEVPGVSHVLNGIQDFAAKVDARLRKLGLPEDTILSVKRTLAEGFRQNDPRASAMAEAIGLDADAAVNEVEAAVKKMATEGKLKGFDGEIAQGEIPSEPVKPNPERASKSKYFHVEEEPVAPKVTPETYQPPEQVIADVGELGKSTKPNPWVEIPATSALKRTASVNEYMAKHPKADVVISRIAEQLDNNPETLPATKAKVADRILSTLDMEGIARLEDPAFRVLVGKEVVRQLRESGVTDKKVLAEKVTSILDNAAKEGIDTHIASSSGKGVTIEVKNIIRDILDKTMTTKERNRVAAHAMEVVGSELAHEAGKATLKHGIEAEQGRFSQTEDLSLSPEKRAAVQAIIDDSNARQQNLAEKGYGPEAKFVGGNVDHYSMNVVKGILNGDLVPQMLPKGVNKTHLAETLRRFADTMSKDSDRNLLVRAAAEIESHVDIDPILGVEGTMEPFFHQSLKWYAKAKQGVQDNALAGFNAMYKRNMTSRNLSPAINNAGSNQGLQLVSRGLDPLSLTENVIRAKTQLSKWQKGKHLPIEEQQFYDALAKGSTLESDMVKADYGTAKSKWDAGQLPGLKWINEHVLEPLYRSGDNLLKLEETHFNYFDKARPFLKMMKDGRYMEVETSNHRSYRIEKVPGAQNTYKVTYLQEATNNKPATIMAGNDPRLIKILVDAAAKPAQDKFFNYSDSGLLGKVMKTLPLIGTKSGFYSYISMAVDIPFVKKGLLYRSLVDIGFNPKTNDPGILVRQAADNVALGARKAIMINGLTQELKDKSNQELGKIFRFMSNEDRSQVALAMSNPGYGASANLGGMNYAQISTSLFRMLADVYTAATRPSQEELYPVKPGTAHGVDINLKGMPYDERQRILRARELVAKHDNGELWSGSDSLVMVGAAGDALRNIVDWISKSSEPGKVLKMDEVWGKFGSIFAGPTIQKGMDLAASLPNNGRPIHTRLLAREMGMDPETLDKYVNGTREFFSSRAKAISADEQLTVPLTQWIIRKFTGLGWQAKNFKEASNPAKPGSYFNKLSKEWKASLQVAERIAEAKKWKAVAKQDAAKAHTADEILKAMQLNDDARVMAKSAARDVKIIQKELRSAYKQYKALASKLLDAELEPWPEDIDEAMQAAAEIADKTPEQLDKEMNSLVDEVNHETTTEDQPIPDDEGE